MSSCTTKTLAPLVVSALLTLCGCQAYTGPGVGVPGDEAIVHCEACGGYATYSGVCNSCQRLVFQDREYFGHQTTQWHEWPQEWGSGAEVAQARTSAVPRQEAAREFRPREELVQTGEEGFASPRDVAESTTTIERPTAEEAVVQQAAHWEDPVVMAPQLDAAPEVSLPPRFGVASRPAGLPTMLAQSLRELGRGRDQPLPARERFKRQD